MWYHLNFTKESEVISMVEEVLLQLLILSLIANIFLTVILFVTIIVITIITYKENHISADDELNPKSWTLFD